jgi:hypothetical protein
MFVASQKSAHHDGKARSRGARASKGSRRESNTSSGTSRRFARFDFKHALSFSAAILLMLATAAAHAEPANGSHVTFYPGQGVKTNLVRLPGRLLDGSLDYRETYFTGIGYRLRTRTPRLLDGTFGLIGMHGVSTGLEIIGVKHMGLQENFEASLSYTLKTPQATIGPIRARFGFSAGASHAFGKPWFENGPQDDPGKRYQTLVYLAHELEWGMRNYEQVSLVTRVHHRSGAFGVVAPRGVGSNFLTAGIRVHW